MGNYLSAEIRTKAIPTDHPAFAGNRKRPVADRINQLMNIKGKQTVESFHKRLGKIMWDKCGMARNAEGLKQAISEIQQLKKDFWSDLKNSW
jgi:succinate dehydrogenase / fumarate reductase flavoprotein subunit